jgi:hypothetical protein
MLSPPHQPEPMHVRFPSFIASYALLNPLKQNGYLCTGRINTKDSTFCLHNVFVCFILFYEWTTIISVNSFDQFDPHNGDTMYFLWGQNWIFNIILTDFRLQRSTTFSSSRAYLSRIYTIHDSVTSVVTCYIYLIKDLEIYPAQCFVLRNGILFNERPNPIAESNLNKVKLSLCLTN